MPKQKSSDFDPRFGSPHIAKRALGLQPKKNVKTLQDKLDAFMIEHNWTLASLDEQREATTRVEQSFKKLMEAKTKQERYEKQMMAEWKLAEEIQLRMYQELARMLELYEKEKLVL